MPFLLLLVSTVVFAESGLRNPYPEIQPFDSGRLQVDAFHSIYYEQSGSQDPAAEPVLGIHGGPGGKASEKLRQLFNPQKQRIILFDQRGCGKSFPFGELSQNTTEHLLQDIDKLLNHLGLESVIIYGGSWGSTLALLYALRFPNRVKRLILRGTFLARQIDQHFDYGVGEGSSSVLFPDEWSKLIKHIPPQWRTNLLGYLYEVFTARSIEADKITLYRALTTWDDFLMGLEPEPKKEVTLEHLVNVRTLMHYEKNGFFIQPWANDHFLDSLKSLHEIPTHIVHGENDRICSAAVAYQVAEKIDATFELVRGAGHTWNSSPSMIDALIRAAE